VRSIIRFVRHFRQKFCSARREDGE